MNPMNRRFFCLVFVLGLTWCAAGARALVVGDSYPPGANPPTGTTPPTVVDSGGDNIGGNVGTFNGDSCIYVGNGWVLTADHVGAGNPVFPGVNGGQAFTYDGTSGRQLTTPDGTGSADLYLFHLTTNPSLPNISISNTSGSALAANMTSVIMYGHGQTASSGFSYYDTSQNPYAATASTTAEGGYAANGPQTFRWGTNFVAGAQADVDDGFGKTNSLVTVFNPNFGAYAQASFGDSGGAVFGKMADGSYTLVGMMYAIGNDLPDNVMNQPSNSTAVFSLNTLSGNGTTTADSLTASADLSEYLNQIDAITGVPEPSTRWVAVLVGAVLLGSCRRRISTRCP